MESKTIEDGKVAAILAYLTLLGWIVALVLNMEKKNEYAKFHIRQALVIMISGFVLGLVNVIPILGQIVFLIGMIALLVFWIMGFIRALSGNTTPIPLVGEKAQEWFKSI